MVGGLEAKRLETLRSYRILDTGQDALFDALTLIAAKTFEVGWSALTLIDEERQWIKSHHGGRGGVETSLLESIRVHAIRGGEVFVIPDALQDPRCAGNPLIRGEHAVRFYAGAPLVAENGHSLGALCVFDREPRTPDERQIEILRNLARLAMSLLDAHRAGFEFREEKEHLLRIADNSPGGLFEFAMDGEGNQWLQFASAGVRGTIGISPQEALEDIRNVFGNVHPDDAPGFVASIEEAFRNRSRWECEFRVHHPTRGELWLLGVSHPANTDRDVVTWQGCIMDITERIAERQRLVNARTELERQYRELEEYQKVLAQIGQMAKVGAFTVELATGKLTWTPELYTMHGVDDAFQPTLAKMIGFCDPERRDELARRVEQLTATGGKLRFEYAITAANGRRRWLRAIGQAECRSDGTASRLVGSLQDITNERTLLERVRYHAAHDHLTRLANRPAFFGDLTTILAQSGPNDVHALAFMDIDHFKDVNDAFGYEFGDRVISVVADRLNTVIESHGGRSQVARFGGDEFAVLLADLKDADEARAIVQSITDEIATDVVLGGRGMRTAVSMGVSIYPEHGADAASLFRKADLALRHSKKAGRARFTVFTRNMEEEASADQLLKSEMLRGMEADEFEAHYQPIVDLANGALEGFEALLRWKHPERGLVSAGVFAHLIDDPTIGGNLSTVVIDQVAETIRHWSAKGLPFGRIAINITSSQLRNPSFEQQLADIIAAGIEPSRLKLEITEGVLLGRSADQAVAILSRIREMGFSIALDDFGTGYASLVHLTEFPIDQIKIDMSFVRKIATSEKDATIVQTMCALANGLNLTAVAEGIEDAGIEKMLRSMGCHYGQGYLYAKALPRNEAEAIIADFSAGRMGTQETAAS